MMEVNLWTILNEKAYKVLIEHKHLSANIQVVDIDFKEAYDWMRNQMIWRLGEKKSIEQFPIWAWYQAHHIDKKKPDLRYSGYLMPGETGYRVEFKKEEYQVLLSDFELWHCVLNKTYIPKDIEDRKKFENVNRKYLDTNCFNAYPQSLKNKIEKSWHVIFDMNFFAKDIGLPFSKKQIQATVWDLKLQEVVKIDKFIAR